MPTNTYFDSLCLYTVYFLSDNLVHVDLTSLCFLIPLYTTITDHQHILCHKIRKKKRPLMPLSDNQGFIPSSPKPDYTPKSLRTLSIKQLKSLPTDTPTHTIDNSTLSTICVAGWVRSTRQAQSGTIFVLDDGTAMINASFWPNGMFEEEQAGLIEPNNFLRVIGNVRVYDGDISVLVSFLTKIDDFNYVSYHFLNVLQQHLHCRRELKRETRKEKEKEGMIGTLQEDVLMCYRNNQDEKGLHVDLVVKMLQGKYKEQDVREMVNSLLDDCYLFSVDGMCYKTVD